jgi:hypothetical protein
MFVHHREAGFLFPLYEKFCLFIQEMSEDFEGIVEETRGFIQFLVAVYTEVYSLKGLNRKTNGFLFKNENLFNLIMTNLFKTTKLSTFLRKVIKKKWSEKIELFE